MYFADVVPWSRLKTGMPVRMRAVDEAPANVASKDNIREAAHKRGVHFLMLGLLPEAGQTPGPFVLTLKRLPICLQTTGRPYMQRSVRQAFGQGFQDHRLHKVSCPCSALDKEPSLRGQVRAAEECDQCL